MDDELEYNRADFVKDPASGEVLTIERTVEYSRALVAFHRAECQHPSTTQYRVRVANDAVQVRNCCVECGGRVGTALSQRDKAWVDSLPWQPEEHAATYTSRRNAERQAILLDLARRQYAERGRFTKSYTEYMASRDWRTKRSLVLKRCGGVCEGCGLEKATEVHHATYDHLFNEFLFELVGLCHSCHERLTLERRTALGIDKLIADDEREKKTS